VLGRRSPQASLFDGDQIYLDHVGRNTFYAFLARERHRLFRDEDFAGLYHESWGRPSVPPSTLCVALVLQTYAGCSDQEASERAAYDQRWKVALGAGEMERPFAKSTLQMFRAQLLVHGKEMELFEASLEAARRASVLRRDGQVRVALDTTRILGRGAVKDTYNLLGDGIVRVMRVLARQSGKPLEEWARAKELAHYLGSSLKGEAGIDWEDGEARQALLGQLVEDAERVLELARRARGGCAPGSQDEDDLVKASEVLGQVLAQDVERKPEGEVEIRQGTSADRVCSVHDPEMRHGRKSKTTRFDGHKLGVAVDVESQVITAVDVMAGSAKDDEDSLELAEQSEQRTGLEVESALGDCAYGSGPNRERFEKAGIELLAKVPAPRSSEFYGKHEFEIDLERMTCRCPAGQVTSKLRRHGYERDKAGRPVRLRQAFQFEAAICAACPLRQQCYKPDRREGRQIEVTGHETRIQAARAWQQSPQYERFRIERQVVEHRIARLAQLGIRQARYVGRTKTRFQALLAATVANLTLVADLRGRRKTFSSGQEWPDRLTTALHTRLVDLLARLSTRRRRSKPITLTSLRRQPDLVPALETASFRPNF
jgi:DDE family transposase/transposase-like protein DUF772